MSSPSHVTLSIPVEETSGVGEARRAAVRMSNQLGFNEQEAGRAGLIVTEAATNLLHHAGTGELLLRALVEPTAPGIEIIALDRGPGMTNVTECLRDGFSTKGTSGNGLGAIARQSSMFDIFSVPNQGTAVLARIFRAAATRADERTLEYGVVCVAKRGEQVCGDAWAVTSDAGRDVVVMLDGLGHGLPAFEAVQEGLRTYWAHTHSAPLHLLQNIHRDMSGTRGAVGAVLCHDRQRGDLSYVGVGNIAASLLAADGSSSSFVSHPGTLGHVARRFQEFKHALPAEGILLMHSDGLSSHWAFGPYPGLLRKDPSLIAGVLYRDFASRRDDVVVLIARNRRKE